LDAVPNAPAIAAAAVTRARPPTKPHGSQYFFDLRLGRIVELCFNSCLWHYERR
jgi:hypothetical protein